MIVTEKDFEYNFDEIAERRKIAEEEGLTEAAEKLGAFRPYSPSELFDGSSICFLCGDKLTIPCIMWSGCTGDRKHKILFAGKELNDCCESLQLWLHIDCAKLLGDKLLADWKEYDERQRECPF